MLTVTVALVSIVPWFITTDFLLAMIPAVFLAESFIFPFVFRGFPLVICEYSPIIPADDSSVTFISFSFPTRETKLVPVVLLSFI